MAIIGVGAIVRFATLDLQSLHHDEAVTAVRILVPDFTEMLDVMANSERSPPLYYVLAWLWTKVFGLGEIGLRSLSALVGTLTIPAAYLAGRELASRRAGLLTAALVALSPILVWYSQEARSYALLVLFCTLAIAYFARSVASPTSRSLALWAAMCALALLSHYFAVFLIAPQVLWLLYGAAPERRRAALAAAAAVVAVGLALLPLALAQEGGDRENLFADRALSARALEVGLDEFAGEQPDPFSGERNIELVQGGALAAGALALAVAGFMLVRWGTVRERRGAAYAAGIGACAVFVPFAMAVGGLDFVNPRNMVGVGTPLLLVLGIGFSTAGARRWGPIAAGCLCAVFACVLAATAKLERMQRKDWRSVAEAIGDPDGRRILIVNSNGDDPFDYYLDAEEFRGERVEDGIRTRDIVTVSGNPSIDPPRGWGAPAHERISIFNVSEFTPRRAQLVRPDDYANEDVIGEPMEVMIDRPG